MLFFYSYKYKNLICLSFFLFIFIAAEKVGYLLLEMAWYHPLNKEHEDTLNNYIECIDILDEYVCTDLVNLILSYHCYTDIISNMRWRLNEYDYKVLLKFITHKRHYDFCKRYLSTKVDDNIVKLILTYHDYDICLNYRSYMQCIYACTIF